MKTDLKNMNQNKRIIECRKSHIKNILHYDKMCFNQYKNIMLVDRTLTRQLVSFQANKIKPFYRWFKYKEGFSTDLVKKYIIERKSTTKKILDPFAGIGTTLFTASEIGVDSVGIELLPIGNEIIETRYKMLNKFNFHDYEVIKNWIKTKPWIKSSDQKDFIELKITAHAYPKHNFEQIKKYLYTLEQSNGNVKKVLFLALLCILERISYTRKDGQYLRWDQRSGRCLGARLFNKGEIYDFNKEITTKLKEITSDVNGESSNDLFTNIKTQQRRGIIEILKGSCLDILPKIENKSIDLIITSPPYCNRYDYTRTYALELAMLGINEQELLKLRQTMLSATVENRDKDLVSLNNHWINALEIAKNNKLLNIIIEYLEFLKTEKLLNNNGVPRMVKNYFFEMACVIYELYRVLTKNGQVIMVNDNVRYEGASVSVDLILSSIANNMGFEIEKIAILPNGKGNSSQQMGIHGRESLRKCVYIWRKP
jgi:DNA modification methylase